MTLPAETPLVLGARGLAGSSIAARLETVFPGTIAATRAELDVTDRFRLEAEFERLRPSVIVNAAAISDGDACEVDPEAAERVNSDGAANVARACVAAGVRLVHLSTVAVFDGAAAGPYVESDRPEPRSVLGRTRRAGEARIEEARGPHLILRTGWLFGPAPSCVPGAILRRARDEGAVRLVADETGSPALAADLADAVLRLLATPARGIVHFANTGACSRHAFGRETLRLAGLDPEAAVAVGREGAGRLAPRPVAALLDTALYARLTGAAPRPWEAALAHCLRAPAPGEES
ncbi:MAG: SDR family oxidoreductase [Candidatus Polarisedimenticolia bacterium]